MGEFFSQFGVDLDCDYTRGPYSEFARNGSFSGADFYDGSAAAIPGRCSNTQNRLLIDKEILPEPGFGRHETMLSEPA